MVSAFIASSQVDDLCQLINKDKQFKDDSAGKLFFLCDNMGDLLKNGEFLAQTDDLLPFYTIAGALIELPAESVGPCVSSILSALTSSTELDATKKIEMFTLYSLGSKYCSKPLIDFRYTNPRYTWNTLKVPRI